MKKILTIFFLLIITIDTQAKETITVSPNGSVQSIAKAVDMSKEGDVIRLMPGLYHETGIEINHGLHIIGVDRPVIDGSKKSEDVFLINADNVTIEGLQIQNINHSFLKDLSGISAKNVKNLTIRNNIFINTYFGIYLRRVTHSLVENNKMIGTAIKESTSGNALHLWNCKHVTINNNELRKHRDGIYLEFTDSTTINNNVAQENVRYGLHYMFSGYSQFKKNVFRANGAGVAVMFSKHVYMIENIYENNWGTASYGMLLKEVRDGQITGSTFKKNTVAIFAESASRIKMDNNDFVENGYALRILGSCNDNTITANNFLGNTFDVSTNTSQNPNVFSGNYWSGYSGYDLDKDGIGDVPYKPVTLFSYVSERVPESMVLQRSLLVHIINFAEKVAPSLTPENLKDDNPMMKKIKR